MGVIKLSKRHALSDVGPGDFVNGTGVPLCVFRASGSWNRWPPLKLKTASQVSRMQLFQSFLCILGLQFLEPLSMVSEQLTLEIA